PPRMRAVTSRSCCGRPRRRRTGRSAHGTRRRRSAAGGPGSPTGLGPRRSLSSRARRLSRVPGPSCRSPHARAAGQVKEDHVPPRQRLPREPKHSAGSAARRLVVAGAALPVPADAALDGGKKRVIVAREPLVHVALEAEAPHPRIERLVTLGEVDAGSAPPPIPPALQTPPPR